MKKSVLLLFFAGCVATGIFGIGRKIPMNRVNDLGQREGYWRDSLGEGITHELYYKGGKKDGLFKCFIRNELFLFGEYTADNMSGLVVIFPLPDFPNLISNSSSHTIYPSLLTAPLG